MRVTISSDDPGLFGALVEEELVSVYQSGALGSGAEALCALTEIIDDSIAATAPGLSSATCGELVALLASARIDIDAGGLGSGTVP